MKRCRNSVVGNRGFWRRVTTALAKHAARQVACRTSCIPNLTKRAGKIKFARSPMSRGAVKPLPVSNGRSARSVATASRHMVLKYAAGKPGSTRRLTAKGRNQNPSLSRPSQGLRRVRLRLHRRPITPRSLAGDHRRSGAPASPQRLGNAPGPLLRLPDLLPPTWQA